MFWFSLCVLKQKNILIDANLINLKLVSSDSSKSHIISGTTQELIKLDLIDETLFGIKFFSKLKLKLKLF